MSIILLDIKLKIILELLKTLDICEIENHLKKTNSLKKDNQSLFYVFFSY